MDHRHTKGPRRRRSAPLRYMLHDTFAVCACHEHATRAQTESPLAALSPEPAAAFPLPARPCRCCAELGSLSRLHRVLWRCHAVLLWEVQCVALAESGQRRLEVHEAPGALALHPHGARVQSACALLAAHGDGDGGAASLVHVARPQRGGSAATGRWPPAPAGRPTPATPPEAADPANTAATPRRSTASARTGSQAPHRTRAHRNHGMPGQRRKRATRTGTERETESGLRATTRRRRRSAMTLKCARR